MEILLKYYYEFDDIANRLLKKYITNRNNFLFENTKFDISILLIDVSQGSVLGPLLILYISDLPISTKIFNITLYCDDKTLYINIKYYSIKVK